MPFILIMILKPNDGFSHTRHIYSNLVVCHVKACMHELIKGESF